MATITLVDRIKSREEDAFETLYDEYHKIVHYVIYQIVKDNEITKDLVQETFFTIYNKIEQYDGGNEKYWILQIAKNLAINYYNRTILKEQKVIRNEEIVESVTSKPKQGLGKYDELLDKYFEKDEKDLIVYHVVFGYSYKEIAEFFNENPKTIGKKCRRLVQILKSIVREG